MSCKCGSNCSCGSGCNCNSCNVEKSTTTTVIVDGVAPKMTRPRPALWPRAETGASVDQAATAILATAKLISNHDPNKTLCFVLFLFPTPKNV
ncbi:hypothetical protein M8C21_005013 [Ambrosia artemisiifolia]|uniref:Metallothionein-like protein n=1 Tax=Ambrosia artemisiifolia TaxID=4212 RepID=A0AAD5BS91_AMBAR|nr:hypothetical protein M8C21_005013 [Ambrosia artemisiifolia]